MCVIRFFPRKVSQIFLYASYDCSLFRTVSPAHPSAFGTKSRLIIISFLNKTIGENIVSLLSPRRSTKTGLEQVTAKSSETVSFPAALP